MFPQLVAISVVVGFTEDLVAALTNLPDPLHAPDAFCPIAGFVVPKLDPPRGSYDGSYLIVVFITEVEGGFSLGCPGLGEAQTRVALKPSTERAVKSRSIEHFAN